MINNIINFKDIKKKVVKKKSVSQKSVEPKAGISISVKEQERPYRFIWKTTVYSYRTKNFSVFQEANSYKNEVMTRLKPQEYITSFAIVDLKNQYVIDSYRLPDIPKKLLGLKSWWEKLFRR